MVKNYILVAVIALLVMGGAVYYFRSSQKTATEIAQQYMTPQTTVAPSSAF